MTRDEFIKEGLEWVITHSNKVMSTYEDGLETNAPYDVQPIVVAYVDGGYANSIKTASSGVFIENVLIHRDTKEKHSWVTARSITESEFISQRNVLGELLAAKLAILICIQLGVSNIQVVYDYQGIEKWAIGSWKRNNSLTQGYYKFIQEAQQFIEIDFTHVKGHTGNPGNERADDLATMGLTDVRNRQK